VHSPLATLYRTYLAILWGRHSVLFQEVRFFYNQRQWSIVDIPKPNAEHKQSLGVLAAITYVLVKEFNDLINHNVPRGLMTDEEMARIRKV
jgi:hypothetical protein